MTSETTPPFDPGDYDTDDRVRCRACAEWAWPDTEAEPKVCPECEERYCVECMPAHNCWTEGPS